jgi:hypothetical protein
MNTKWYDRLAAAAAKPTRAERVKAGAEVDAELNKLLKGRKEMGDIRRLARQAGDDEQLRTATSEQIAVVLLGLLAPAVQKIGDANDRAEQTARHGVLAFALAAYHADHQKYPAALADLSPKYLKAVPDDLFSGKAVIYKPVDGGFMLYSVGVNGTDDGGRSFGDEPRGDDLVVRVPKK